MKQEQKLFVNGKRIDGRSAEDFRPMKIEVGLLKRAMGSASFAFGNTFAIVAVYGPRNVHPRHMQEPQKAILRCRYNMAPFSTEERVRPGPSRRSVEISLVTKQALSQVMFFEDYPKTAIDVFIEILQADASTRCAGINAASLALADAGVPMKDFVCSCSAGKIDGQIVLDIGGAEDMEGDVDMTIACVGQEDKIVLLQMDGIMTKEEFLKAFALAKKGCSELYPKLKNALLSRYAEKGGETNDAGS